MKLWNAQNLTILKILNTDRPGTPILVNVQNLLLRCRAQIQLSSFGAEMQTR